MDNSFYYHKQTSLDKVVLKKNSILSEYESYKVRVYSVLKKEKGKKEKNEPKKINKIELLDMI